MRNHLLWRGGVSGGDSGRWGGVGRWGWGGGGVRWRVVEGEEN